MLELLGIKLHVLIRNTEFLERPRNARAGAARPGIQLIVMLASLGRPLSE